MYTGTGTSPSRFEIHIKKKSVRAIEAMRPRITAKILFDDVVQKLNDALDRILNPTGRTRRNVSTDVQTEQEKNSDHKECEKYSIEM